jgi:hypothetical protein
MPHPAPSVQRFEMAHMAFGPTSTNGNSVETIVSESSKRYFYMLLCNLQGSPAPPLPPPDTSKTSNTSCTSPQLFPTIFKDSHHLQAHGPWPSRRASSLARTETSDRFFNFFGRLSFPLRYLYMKITFSVLLSCFSFPRCHCFLFPTSLSNPSLTLPFLSFSLVNASYFPLWRAHKAST